MTSTEYQAALARHLHARLRFTEDVHQYTFVFARGTPQQDAVVGMRVRLPMRDGSALWFSASLGSVSEGPLDHSHQFFGTYDSDDLALTELVSAANHYDRKVERLGYGHSLPLGAGSPLRDRGLEGAVVLQPTIDPMFRGEPPPDQLRTTLYFLVPVTADELALKRSAGLATLLRRWSQDNRLPFTVPRRVDG